MERRDLYEYLIANPLSDIVIWRYTSILSVLPLQVSSLKQVFLDIRVHTHFSQFCQSYPWDLKYMHIHTWAHT